MHFYNLINVLNETQLFFHEKEYSEEEFVDLVSKARNIAISEPEYYRDICKQDLYDRRISEFNLFSLISKVLVDRFEFKTIKSINHKLGADQIKIPDNVLMAIRKKDFRKKEYIQPVLTNVVWEEDDDEKHHCIFCEDED